MHVVLIAQPDIEGKNMSFVLPEGAESLHHSDSDTAAPLSHRPDASACIAPRSHQGQKSLAHSIPHA